MTDEEKQKWWDFLDRHLDLKDMFINLRIQEEFPRLVIPKKQK